MVTEIMALESRWKQEGKHTEHSVTSFSGKCPQALRPRVLYNWKQKGLQEIPLLMMSPLGNQGLSTKLTAWMFPDWQTSITKWRQSTLFLCLRTWETMLPKYSVLQNCAYSSLLQLELSKEILFSSFIGHKQHFCTWNVPWASSIHHQGTPSLRVQGWAALSRDNIPCTPFTWTLPLSDPSVCPRCLLEAHLHRFLQGLARTCILLVHTGFCNWRQIKKNGLLMTLLIHKSCCILKAESSDSCKVGTVWLISTNFTLNNLGNIYMYNTILSQEEDNHLRKIFTIYESLFCGFKNGNGGQYFFKLNLWIFH